MKHRVSPEALAMANTLNIRINRLILAVAATVLLADTYPHPSLSAGLVETLGTRLQVALTQIIND
jgi:hypothetical protein